MNTPVLITGCPKSGTQYVRLMLRKIFKLDVGHERPGYKDGLVSWRAVSPLHDKLSVEGFEAKFLPIDQFKTKLHQVREPVECINSMHLLHRAKNVGWIIDSGLVPFAKKENLGHVSKDVHLFTAMKIWYYWNLKAEELCDWTYRVEQLEEVFDEFCEWIGVVGDIKRVRRMKKTYNSWRKRRGYGNTDWESMRKMDSDLCSKIQKLAIRYGYNI